MNPINIDGSTGEGGGQVLRTSLSLSAITGAPLVVERIRAGRPRPGLRAQHVTAVRAAAKVCGATVEGDELGSQAIEFNPGTPQSGNYRFNVAEVSPSAGSATLVIQTILPILLRAQGTSRVSVWGGTHVPWSPSFHYLSEVFAKALKHLGCPFSAWLMRWGWFPRGGGEITLEVEGGKTAYSLDARGRGDLLRVSGISASSGLPSHVIQRQRKAAEDILGKAGCRAQIQEEAAPAPSKGCFIQLVGEYVGGRAGFSAIGERGKPAPQVAADACDALLQHLESGAVFDPYLADQILLYLAQADGPSRFTTSKVTNHLRTNAWVIERFLPVRISMDESTGEVAIDLRTLDDRSLPR